LTEGENRGRRKVMMGGEGGSGGDEGEEEGRRGEGREGGIRMGFTERLTVNLATDQTSSHMQLIASVRLPNDVMNHHHPFSSGNGPTYDSHAKRKGNFDKRYS
jgi:ribosomal protein L31